MTTELIPSLANVLATRDFAQLPAVSARMCELAVSEPQRATEELRKLRLQIEALIVPTLEADPAARLALADLFNALTCCVEVHDAVREQVVRVWLRQLATEPLGVAPRARIGFAAIALEDPRLAHDIAGTLDENEPRARVLRELVATMTTQSDPYLFMTGVLHREARRQISSIPDIEAASLLWVGRIAQSVMHLLVSSTAVDGRWRVGAYEQNDAQMRAQADEGSRAFPYGERLPGGYTVAEHVQGNGSQQLWLAIHDDSARTALVALDNKMGRQKLDELRAALPDESAGGVTLVHAGHVERPTRRQENEHNVEKIWLVAETCPGGSWLPRLIPRLHDPAGAPRMAIELGISAGQLIARVAAQGTLLLHVRPEYLWGAHENGHWRITGVSDRATRLFSLKRYTAFSYPVFWQFYQAPEYSLQPTDRCLAFTLALMICEWATGRFPSAKLPLDVPDPLRGVLARALRVEASERPTLDAFIAELKQLA